MNNKETLHAIDIMNAHLDGKTIQFKDRKGANWIIVGVYPNWNWLDNEYRIKPESSYRPWRTLEEVPVGKIVKSINGQLRTSIQSAWSIDQNNIMVSFANGDKRTSINTTNLENFTMDDGSPCGIKIE